MATSVQVSVLPRKRQKGLSLSRSLMSLLIKIHRRHKRYPDHLLHGIFGKSAGRQGFHPWDQVQSILGNQVPSIISIQGDHFGLTLKPADFNLGVPPVCPFAMPSLPNFHLSLAELGMQQNKPNQSQRVKPTMVTLHGSNHCPPTDYSKTACLHLLPPLL